MKTAKLSIRFLAYGLCLAATLYNCKTKDVDSLTPFTYTFKGLEAKLPDITPTQPAAVSVVAGGVTSSTAAAAVTSGLSNLSAGGPVPAAVQQAAAAVNNAVSAEKAASLAASFTPDVMRTLSTSGALPESLKEEAAALAANPALKAYLPTFTMPMVNGKVVNGRVGVGANALIEAINVTYLRADDDACKAAANTVFTATVAGLDAAKATQVAAVNAAFTQAQAAANAESAPCKTNVTAKYTAIRTAAWDQYNAGIAALDAAKAVLGQTMYNVLHVLYDVAYAQAIAGIPVLQSADSAACDAIATAKLAAATTAQTTDLNRINSNYNTTIATLTKARDTAIASCHNQGNGG